jgi:hypothetical protein
LPFTILPAGSGTGTTDGTGGTSSPPGPPTNLSATTGDSEVTLSWMPPLAADRVPISSYFVYQGDCQGGNGGTLVDQTTDTTDTIQNLTNGSTYSFCVIAVDAADQRSSPATIGVPLPAIVTPSRGSPSGGSTSPGGGGTANGGSGRTASPLVPAASSGLGLLLLIASVIAVRRMRARSRVLATPHAIVEVVRNSGPPARVHAQTTGTQPTVAVRIEPHPGDSTTVIQEMQR